nr:MULTISPECIES: hypothetical protein [unclassified Pseudomonas]
MEEVGHGQEQCRSLSESRGDEEIRLHCLPGTRQALAELMAWSGIEEQGEAITLMIHHVHAMGPQKCLPMLDPPRHEITISENVSRRLELAFQRELVRVSKSMSTEESY